MLLPLDRYVAELNERYGEAYQESEVEEGEYPGVPATKTIAVPNLLMVRADMDETLAHDLIELMFEHKEELAEVHPSAEKLTLEDARRSSRASSCTRAPSATTRRRRNARRRSPRRRARWPRQLRRRRAARGRA